MKRLEAEAALMSLKIRHAALSAMTEKLSNIADASELQVDHTSSDGSMSPKPLDLSKMSDAALAELQAAMNASPDTDEG